MGRSLDALCRLGLTVGWGAVPEGGSASNP